MVTFLSVSFDDVISSYTEIQKYWNSFGIAINFLAEVFNTFYVLSKFYRDWRLAMRFDT